MWKLLAPMLPNEPIATYGATALRLQTNLPTVPSSSSVHFVSLDLLRSTACQAICNRRRSEAKCHHMVRDTWHYLLYISHSFIVKQCLDVRLVYIICYNVSCIHRNQNEVLCIRRFLHFLIRFYY
jgi:hypothetical protein